MKALFKSTIFQALTLLFLVYTGGVLGFVLFYGYSLIDAIYMTIITITTVGYKEIHPPTTSEKIYISILIITSIFIVGYAIKVISESILSSNNIGNLKQKRMQKKINAMEDHIIICGFGRNGQEAAQKIEAYNKPVVVIEMDEDLVSRYSDQVNFVLGNAEEDEVLKQAGICKAHALIAALPSDSDNLFIVLSAKQLNKNLKIISRASQESSRKKLQLAGADHVILPDRIGGSHMASLVVVPDLVEFLDNLTVFGEEDSINVEQIAFEQICPDGKERAIKDLDLRKRTGCSIIGYKGKNGDYVVNPEPTTILSRESKLIVIGRPHQIEVLKTQFTG